MKRGGAGGGWRGGGRARTKAQLLHELAQVGVGHVQRNSAFSKGCGGVPGHVAADGGLVAGQVVEDGVCSEHFSWRPLTV